VVGVLETVREEIPLCQRGTGEEWGIKGVEVRPQTLLVGIAHPATLVVWM